MTSVLVHVALAVLLPAAGPPAENSYRDPNPLVPSVPQLTDEEEAELDRILDRFIRADIGQEQNPAEFKRALAEVNRLGPESFFALIRALNRAARINDSCPAVVLAAILQRRIMASRDPQLLDYARENIGLGIERSVHMRVLRDLQLLCAMRKRSLGNAYRGPSSADMRETRRLHPMTVSELVQAIGVAKGHRRVLAMDELGRRDDDQAVATLAAIAGDKDDQQRTHARALLVRHLLRLKTPELKEWFKDPRAEVRIAAARAASHHQPPLTSSLIDLLSDENVVVRSAAHGGLLRISHGKDFGPDDHASETVRKRAIQHWRDWLAQQ